MTKMNRIALVFLFLIAASAISVRALALQIAPASSFVDPQAAEKANAHEDELYNSATSSLTAGDYEHAAAEFDEVAKMRGRKADAALYWKAYALNKAGNKSQALTTIAELKKSYPQSKYVKDAGVIEVEIRPSV